MRSLPLLYRRILTQEGGIVRWPSGPRTPGAEPCMDRGHATSSSSSSSFHMVRPAGQQRKLSGRDGLARVITENRLGGEGHGQRVDETLGTGF